MGAYTKSMTITDMLIYMLIKYIIVNSGLAQVWNKRLRWVGIRWFAALIDSFRFH